MPSYKKNYFNGSLFGNFNSNVDDKFNYLFTNIVDAHYDYLLSKEESEFQAISLSDVATGQANGSMRYPNSAKIIKTQVIKNGVADEQRRLAVKVRPTNLKGSVLPDPFQTENQDERNFAIGMHEWAISDVPFENLNSIPAGSEITCFYADGRDLGFNEKTLFFRASSLGGAFMSLISQGFTGAGSMIAGMFNGVQDPATMAQYQTTYLNIPPRWPGAVPTIPQAVITSPFGPRRPPTTSGGQGSSDHGGIDIAGGAPNGGRGTPIYAVNDGRVSAINPNSKTAGKMIFIKHPGGWQTEYMHLDSILVGYGDVSKGQVIGTMGNTGNSSGTHLHFTVRKDGKKVDPLLVFGWNYTFSNKNTEARYRERLAAAGVGSPRPTTSSDSLYPPESPAE
jgi:murein DD-endopeptidase MepM/ murein hydrolase activator NlpD